jgi:hypothetical protein
MNAAEPASPTFVPEDRGRLTVIDSHGCDVDTVEVLGALRCDKVVLLRAVRPEQVDCMLHALAHALGLLDRMAMQAAFAGSLGHRRQVGKYGMTVNSRDAWQFIPPHSEGNSFINLQMASFYCFENTTDGGETIFMNVDDSSEVWRSLREKVTRIAPDSRPLTQGEMRRATAMYHLHSPAGLRDDDHVLAQRESAIPGLKLLEVLARPRRTRSVMLERDVHAYWDSIASIDFDSAGAYVRTLRNCGLLKAATPDFDVKQMDNAAPRRVWSSGVDHNALFKCRITCKLAPGDLTVMNNLTWTHSAANWNPSSGIRDLAAAFA